MTPTIPHQVLAPADKRTVEIARLFSKGYPHELPLRLGTVSSQFERTVGSPMWRKANGKCLIELGAAYQDGTGAIVLKADAALAIRLLTRDKVSGEIKPGNLFREDQPAMALHDAFEEIAAGDPFKGKRITQSAPGGFVLREFKLRPGVCIEGINRELPANLRGAKSDLPEAGAPAIEEAATAAADRLSQVAESGPHVEVQR